MVINKRKKNSRQRGSWTHGWGAKKKHRGAGHRGGRGAAGSGKRADAKKPSIWKDPKYAGKHGFASKADQPNAPITLQHLEMHLKTLLSEGVVRVEGGLYVADLQKAGYTKLLATGIVTKKWQLTIPHATPGAIEKVKNAGGAVTVTRPPVEKKKKQAAGDEGKSKKK